jgi:hypothetical protein
MKIKDTVSISYLDRAKYTDSQALFLLFGKYNISMSDVDLIEQHLDDKDDKKALLQAFYWAQRHYKIDMIDLNWFIGGVIDEPVTPPKIDCCNVKEEKVKWT